jgi:hypothetical protein
MAFIERRRFAADVLLLRHGVHRRLARSAQDGVSRLRSAR